MQKRASVFINAPFDDEYAPLLNAIVFAVCDCGFIPRTAMEVDDGSLIRFEKICELMSACAFGIHDISRTELDGSKLPRFNMPLELGLFLGAKRFGAAIQRKKNCLILDRSRYRFQKYCSDIAGQDIRDHANKPRLAISRVRDWLANDLARRGTFVRGATLIARRYAQFLTDLPVACQELGLRPRQLTFMDLRLLIDRWQFGNP